jgi:hypothetical protein
MLADLYLWRLYTANLYIKLDYYYRTYLPTIKAVVYVYPAHTFV